WRCDSTIDVRVDGDFFAAYLSKRATQAHSALLRSQIPHGLIERGNDGELRQRPRDGTHRVEISIRGRSSDDCRLESAERLAHCGLSLPDRRFADARSAIGVGKLNEAPHGLGRNA